MDEAEAAPRLDRAVPQDVGRESTARRIGEQALGDHLDAGEDVRRDSRSRAAAEPAEAVHVEIALPAMIAGARLRHEQQQRVHPRIVPPAGEEFEAIAGAVDPEIVAVDDEERITVDHRCRLDQPSAGFEQQCALVGDGDGEFIGLGREMGFELIGEIVDVDHQLADARGAEPVEDVVDQWLAVELHQRLGMMVGQRAHPLAEAGGHDHRGVGHRRGDLGAETERAAGGHAASVQAAARLSAGMLASNQARTGSSPGCARSRSSRPHMRGWNAR